MEMGFLLLGIAFGFALGWFIQKTKHPTIDQGGESTNWQDKYMQASIALGAARNAEEMLLQREEKLKLDLTQNQETIIQLNNQYTAAQSSLKNLEERLGAQKGEVEELNKRYKLEFEQLANRILEEKSQKFTEQNKLSLDGILTPLKEKIKDFEEKVQKVYDTEAAERNMLKGEIKQLIGLNQQMHVDTQNLTKALKGDNKAQGNWGEFILESILEKSGLVKDREYKTQESITSEDGRRFQPDVVIQLPDGKCLIIDSKVSLVAYERYISTDDELMKMQALKEHGLSFKSHIKGLSEKNYQNLYGIKSLDFVLLFVPIESAFAAAVQYDNQVFNDAFERNIVIVSPSTLLATLRTVANIWRQENQNKNSMLIAEHASKLYDKFEGFTTDLIDIGRKMDQAKGSYQEAMKKLSTGPGNLIRKVEELREMGVKSKKSIQKELLERSTDET